MSTTQSDWGRRATLSVVVAVTSAIGLHSQSQTVPSTQAAVPAFEAASVKRIEPSGRGPIKVQPGGRLVATGVPLTRLLLFAYDILDVQLVGEPDWASKDLFEIVATAGHNAPDAEVRLMLQSLLEERFHLVLRREQREMPIHEIVLARADGRLGARLVQVSSEEECRTAATKLPPRPAFGRTGAASVSCGPVSRLAPLVFAFVRTAVIDKTGLTGLWFWSMYFAPDDTAFAWIPPEIRQLADPNLPSFSTAFEEQLGLKLRPARGPVDVLVIDHVEHPTPD